jgi:hypothetical protein
MVFHCCTVFPGGSVGEACDIAHIINKIANVIRRVDVVLLRYSSTISEFLNVYICVAPSGMTPLVIELRRGRCEVRSTIGIGESKPPADRILHPCATDVPSREISGSDGANIGMHARLDKFKNRTACDLRS